MLRALAPLIAIVCVAACADVLDIDGIEISDGDTGGAPAAGGGGTSSTSDGGSATSQGGSTTSQGGMGGVLQPGAENCANGIDDNDDDLVDCEDPLCGAFTCAETAPADWQGPYASHIAASAAACPTSAPVELLEGGNGVLTAPDAVCSSCTCTTPDNVTCSIPMLDFWDSEVCDAHDGDLAPNAAGVCEQVSSPNGVDSMSARPSVASGGGCIEGGGTPTLPETSFENEVRICGANTFGGGCGTGSVCMPAPESPFSDKACIIRSGDRECPAGPYTDRSLVYAGVADTRACSSCSCGTPNGVACQATTTVYEDNACNIGAVAVPHDDSCVTTNYSPNSWRFDVTFSGGSCPESGGAPTGEANPDNPTTICCVP